MVVCEADNADTDLVLHAPIIIVEVLSSGTRKYDMTAKKIAYLNIPSLQEYLLIEQDRCEVEVFRRIENWASTYYVLGDVINFDSDKILSDTKIKLTTKNDRNILNYLTNLAMRSERERRDYDFMKSMEQAFIQADRELAPLAEMKA
jgi:hypothetical protein